MLGEHSINRLKTPKSITREKHQKCTKNYKNMPKKQEEQNKKHGKTQNKTG